MIGQADGVVAKRCRLDRETGLHRAKEGGRQISKVCKNKSNGWLIRTLPSLSRAACPPWHLSYTCGITQRTRGEVAQPARFTGGRGGLFDEESSKDVKKNVKAISGTSRDKSRQRFSAKTRRDSMTTHTSSGPGSISGSWSSSSTLLCSC